MTPISRSNSQHVLRRRSQSAEVACPAPTFRGSWMAKSDKPTCSKCPGGVHRRSPTVQVVHWQPHLPTHTRNRRWRLQGPSTTFCASCPQPWRLGCFRRFARALARVVAVLARNFLFVLLLAHVLQLLCQSVQIELAGGRGEMAEPLEDLFNVAPSVFVGL